MGEIGLAACCAYLSTYFYSGVCKRHWTIVYSGIPVKTVDGELYGCQDLARPHLVVDSDGALMLRMILTICVLTSVVLARMCSILSQL